MAQTEVDGFIGYIPRGKAAPDLLAEVGRFCAAPRHLGQHRAGEFIVAISPCTDYPDGILQATCEDCLADMRTDDAFPDLSQPET